jgi:hypothetical protein
MREFAPSVIDTLAGNQLGHDREIITIASFFFQFLVSDQGIRRTYHRIDLPIEL